MTFLRCESLPQSLFEFRGAMEFLSIGRRFHPFSAEPEHKINAMSIRAGIADIPENQLLVDRSPEILMSVFLDFNRDVESARAAK